VADHTHNSQPDTYYLCKTEYPWTAASLNTIWGSHMEATDENQKPV